MKSEHDILPELQGFIAASPIVDLEDLPQDLELPPLDQTPCKEVTCSEEWIPAQERQIRVLRYSPVHQEKERTAALLWIHGGGYFAGAPEADAPLCRQFVLEAGVEVIAVDYRLAPKHPYPAGLEDCYAALRWMEEEAANLCIDPGRIAVAGVSAGGGLTAALTLLARDRGGPKIAFQMPLYPMLDDTGGTPSAHEITRENFPHVWNRSHNQTAWRWYLGERCGGDTVPVYAAPYRAQSLAGLPPAYTCIGSLDLFRDETIDYVARLSRADVPVEFHLYPGCYHAFEVASDTLDICVRARAEYVSALRKGLGG